MIRLIAAIDSQRGIATDSGIPWKLPGDSAYFREKTAQGSS
jgi:dihydrofolate reductase